MIARRLGHSVVLIERHRHPRFAIGESSTPLANLVWEELARRYDLPRLLPFAKWGTWREAYPGIACGLKRGFTFHHHNFDEPWDPGPDRQRQLLVAASPHDRIADTHWFREDFDNFLVAEAVGMGVTYLDETKLTGLGFEAGNARLSARRSGEDQQLEAEFVIDATGPRGALTSLLGLTATPLDGPYRRQSWFTHFRNVRRFDKFHRSDEAPPFPPDDAALHHVFPGGWIWVLRFSNGITSAGASLSESLVASLGAGDGASPWACWKRSSCWASGRPLTCTWPTRARASVTRVKVSCSKSAAPLTVATRLGTRSARRW
jgi:FADH2 O2-dependent halogenase